MTSFHVEEISARRKSAEAAIQLALESRWEEAAEANQEYLDEFPNDTEALNRLGKALMELGRYDESRDAYQKSYDLDHVANVIAKKNLQRLEGLSQSASPRPEGSPKIAAQLFIEETGKTGIANLLGVAERALKLLAAGDSVDLKAEGKSLFALDAAGEKIGEVDPKVGLRLVPLIESGNQYAAAMHGVDNDGARVIIRETFQSEANVGKLSFAPGQVDAVRGYTRDSLLRTDDDEEDLGEEAADDWVDTEAVAEAEEEPEAIERPRIAGAVEDEEFEE
jgi:tetratricopeptide (TPR) repeat protein